MNVVDIMSFSCRQLPVLPQEHHPGHRGIVILRAREIEPNVVPLPKIVDIVSITFTQVENNTLRFTGKVGGSASSKMECTEPPEFMVFIFPFQCRVDDMNSQLMPLGKVDREIVEHSTDIDVALLTFDKDACWLGVILGR